MQSQCHNSAPPISRGRIRACNRNTSPELSDYGRGPSQSATGQHDCSTHVSNLELTGGCFFGTCLSVALALFAALCFVSLCIAPQMQFLNLKLAVAGRGRTAEAALGANTIVAPSVVATVWKAMERNTPFSQPPCPIFQRPNAFPAVLFVKPGIQVSGGNMGAQQGTPKYPPNPGTSSACLPNMGCCQQGLQRVVQPPAPGSSRHKSGGWTMEGN